VKHVGGALVEHVLAGDVPDLVGDDCLDLGIIEQVDQPRNRVTVYRV